jgi:hypothetical protein
VEILEFQITLKTSDIVQTLEEMAVLTQELLTLDPSSTFTTRSCTHFLNAFGHGGRPYPVPPQPLNKIIDCLRLLKKLNPDLSLVHLTLATCLGNLYFHTLNDEPLHEIASIMDEMVASGSPGDKAVARCRKMVPELAMDRLMGDHIAENSEDAIYRARTFLASSSVEDPLYPTWTRVLEHAAKKHFVNFGPIDALEASSSDSLPSRPVAADDSVLTSKMGRLHELLDGMRNNDATSKIDKAIELGRSILASSDASPDPSDPDASLVFADILFEAFKRTNKIKFLIESIANLPYSVNFSRVRC